MRFLPLDVLLFRDGRPFDFSTSFATSLSFPYPSTFSGALRKLFGDVLEVSTNNWNALLGDAEKTPLLFSGPFFEKDGKLFVRAPMILLSKKKDDSGKVAGSLKVLRDSPEIVNIKNTSAKVENLLWSKSAKPLEPVNAFVRISDLMDLIEGRKKLNEVRTYKINEFIADDVRTHLRIEGRTAAKDDGKFSVRYIALKDGVSFVVGVERGSFEKWDELLMKLPERSTVRLGGEGRQAVVERVKDKEVLNALLELRRLEDEESNTRIFITPFAFEKEDLSPVFAVTSKAKMVRGRNYKGVSKIFGIYDSGSVISFRNFGDVKSTDEFKDFRSLGYNMSVKGGMLV